MNNYLLALLGIAKTSSIIVTALLPIVCILMSVTYLKQDKNWFKRYCSNTLIKIWEL